jgi:hypothetical protein
LTHAWERSRTAWSATEEGDFVANAKDDHVEALDKALKEIRKDAAAFKSDPKGKVPELDANAAQQFGDLSVSQLQGLAEADDTMKKVGYTVSAGGVSVRMV